MARATENDEGLTPGRPRVSVDTPMSSSSSVPGYIRFDWGKWLNYLTSNSGTNVFGVVSVIKCCNCHLKIESNDQLLFCVFRRLLNL